MSLRNLLRTATRAEHDRVDALGESFDLASQAGYGAFLHGHALALPALEAQVLAHGPHPDHWPLKRRTEALRQDLAALGQEPPRALAAPDLPSRSMRLGALYVIEGSRLGGMLLSRRLAAVQPDAPRAYLDHDAGPGYWRDFLAWLEDEPDPVGHADQAVEGARRAFAFYAGAFERAAAERTQRVR
ncbi:MAG TPA: biliverdin-producing heme oxygenase [Phenylobacterium sp.]|nr:biliverdin-producing heme oxygenase [Phenylobacterium sp.]